MHPEALRSLANELEDIAKQAEVGDSASTPNWRIWNMDGGALTSLEETQAQRFDGLVKNLAQKEVWRDKWSTSYIEKQLLVLIRTMREAGDTSALDALSRLDDEVTAYSQECTVYIPISGLLLEMDELPAGRVVFKRSSMQLKSEMKARVTALYPQWSPETRENLTLQDTEEVAMRSFQTHTNAEYRVIAEPIRAAERAREEARRATEILTLACAARYPTSQVGNTAISLEGEGYLVGPTVTVVTAEGLNISQSAVESSMPVEFGPSSLLGLEETGISELFKILERPVQQLTDIEQALLRSVHWFATAQAQVELENRLLNLITSLEALLSPQARSPISASISESVALLLKQPFDERKDMKAFISRMYAARSSVSHGGNRAVFEPDTRQLRDVVAQLILHVLHMRDSIRSRQDLLDWTERLRLGGASA